MEAKDVHYIEFGVLDGLKYVQKFLSQYSFRLVGTRVTPASKQWLVSSHHVRFLITELSKNVSMEVQKDPYVHCWVFPTDVEFPPVRESVFNIALRVNDMDRYVKRLSNCNVQFLKPLQTVTDQNGSVRVCMVKSYVGNVVHTLVDDSKYPGVFLPGFETIEGDDDCPRSDDKEDGDAGLRQASEKPVLDFIDFIDHVAFCVPCGSSSDVISWYERCFGMERFLVNRDDDEEKGFVISGPGIGLRVKAFKSRKDTVSDQNTDDCLSSTLEFVTVETLPDDGPNQLDTFLTHHGGPGVHHVALHTGHIIGAITQLQANGVQFNEPPYTYYTEVGKLKDMVTVKVDVDLIRQKGILIDLEYEEDNGDHTTNGGADSVVDSPRRQYRYLMQKFTRPLFGVDTCFLEVIQRVGATGFGSGNVTALWRSVQAYLQEKEAQSARDAADSD